MIAKTEIIKEMKVMKKMINSYLIKNGFEDEELFEIAINIEGYLDQYEYDNLSEEEKRKRAIMGEDFGMWYEREEYMKNFDK